MNLQKHGRLLFVLIFLGAVFILFERSGWREHFTLTYIHQQFEHNQFTGFLLFTALFAIGNLAQVPGWIFLAAAVLVLGEAVGGVATYVAATFSCVTTFVLIRLIGGDALRQMDNRLAVKLLEKLDAHPLQSVILLRILFQTVPALNYALALSGIRFRQYLLGTLCGLPLPIAIYCVFFEHIAKTFHLH